MFHIICLVLVFIYSIFICLFNCRWLCSHCFGHSKFKWQILTKINSHPDDCCGNSHPKLWSQIQILYNWMIFFDKLSEFSKNLKPDCSFTQVLLWFSPTSRDVWVYNYQYFDWPILTQKFVLFILKWAQIAFYRLTNKMKT